MQNVDGHINLQITHGEKQTTSFSTPLHSLITLDVSHIQTQHKKKSVQKMFEPFLCRIIAKIEKHT